MIKQDAVKEAENQANSHGGVWHVVKIGGEHYDVHDAWFKTHIGISLYQTPDYYSSPIIIHKPSLWRNVVTSFNKLLLWLFRRFIDAKRDYRKT
jgi:hypothetical protein